MNFLKSFFASLLGSFAAFGLALFFFFIFIASIATTFSAQEAITSIKEDSVLFLDLNKGVRDRAQQLDEFQELFGLKQQVLGLNTIIGGIKKAAADDRIKGIKLRADFAMAGCIGN